MVTKFNQLFLATFIASLGVLLNSQKTLAMSDSAQERGSLPAGSVTTKDGLITVLSDPETESGFVFLINRKKERQPDKSDDSDGAFRDNYKAADSKLPPPIKMVGMAAPDIGVGSPLPAPPPVPPEVPHNLAPPQKPSSERLGSLPTVPLSTTPLTIDAEPVSGSPKPVALAGSPDGEIVNPKIDKMPEGPTRQSEDFIFTLDEGAIEATKEPGKRQSAEKKDDQNKNDSSAAVSIDPNAISSQALSSENISGVPMAAPAVDKPKVTVPASTVTQASHTSLGNTFALPFSEEVVSNVTTKKQEDKNYEIALPNQSVVKARDSATNASSKERVEQMLHGIDLSAWDKDVDFSLLKEYGIGFAYLKATEGRSFKDPDFYTNRTEARKAGIIYGAYHYFRPATPVMEQVDNFLDRIGKIKSDDLPPALDLEDPSLWRGYSTEEKKTMILTWLNEVERRTGVRPIIYASPAFIRTVLSPVSELADYKLWLAHHTEHSKPDLPAPFKSWLIWQYSKKGNPPGVTGQVDLNRYDGNVTQLLAESRSRPTSASILGQKSQSDSSDTGDPALNFSSDLDS